MITLLAWGLPVLLCCIVLHAVASRLPADHVARASVHLDCPPHVAWDAVIDVEAYPRWRTGVARVHRLPDVDGRLAWCEVGPGGNRLHVRATSVVAHVMMTLVTVGDELPFQCTWFVSLQPNETGTLVTVQERCIIRSVVLRAVAQWFLGRDEGVRLYVADLKRWSRRSAVCRDAARQV